jgi:hypothetical protein
MSNIKYAIDFRLKAVRIIKNSRYFCALCTKLIFPFILFLLNGSDLPQGFELFYNANRNVAFSSIYSLQPDLNFQC